MITLALTYTQKGTFKEKRGKVGINNRKAIIEYITWGFRANQIEACYSNFHPDSKSVENVRSYFFHIFLIQKRGTEFQETYLPWQSLLKQLIDAGVQDVDGLKYKNFCTFEDKIKLIDYGSNKTIEILNSFLEKTLTNHYA